MFPITEQTAGTQSSIETGNGIKTYLFDFETGDFVVRDGKLAECDGVDAVRMWIEKIIRTEKNRYKIYTDTEYGCHLEDLVIGNNYTPAFIEAELKREIEDALMQHPLIQRISGFMIERSTNAITVTLEVNIDGKGTNSITVTV